MYDILNNECRTRTSQCLMANPLVIQTPKKVDMASFFFFFHYSNVCLTAPTISLSIIHERNFRYCIFSNKDRPAAVVNPPGQLKWTERPLDRIDKWMSLTIILFYGAFRLVDVNKYIIWILKIVAHKFK